MVHVDYLMIAIILERCDLWQSCDLTIPNEFNRTAILGKLLFTEIKYICIAKIRHYWTTSKVLRRVNVKKRPKLVNTKKADGSDLDHPMAVNTNDKVILTVCLYACASTCVLKMPSDMRKKIIVLCYLNCGKASIKIFPHKSIFKLTQIILNISQDLAIILSASMWK